jgi:hypothetical protein
MTKKVVKYSELSYCEVGSIAYLRPTDHPGVSNNSIVRTSEVLRYDPCSGEIETRNTRYIRSSDTD